MEHIEGMTVNERLFHFDLMESFENAIEQKDKMKAVEILIKSKFTKQQAEYTVSTILKND